jgi:hypothetical protein
VVTPPLDEPMVIDEQRDAASVVVDTVLGMAAGLPARLMLRVEAAFDELLTQSHG